MTTTEPAIYVGTYGKYNNGSIAGKWLNLKDYDSKAAFYKACSELHSDEDDPEFMFQDFEGYPKELYDESGFDERIIQYAQMEDDDREVVDEYANAIGYLPDDLADCRDAYYTTLTSFNREREFGEYYAESSGLEIPDDIANYFDYETYGRDLLMDFSMSDNGYVFYDNA